MSMPDFGDLYFGPWVMRNAWQKVQTWYASGEWYDPAEMLAWKSDIWRRLEDLSCELTEQRFKPDPFPMIPYPKKNDQTRHYLYPSIRDQVAFATFLVLLGPFLEARMPNVSFGNRLFRPRVLLPPKFPLDNTDSKTDSKTVRWFRLPFSLGHHRLYDSFSSSYGLFRRLLQWIVNKHLLDDKESDALYDEIKIHDPDLLPYLNNLQWEKSKNLYYTRFDLSLAYPSVNRDQLACDLRKLLSAEISSVLGDQYLKFHWESWGLPRFPALESPTSKSPFTCWLEQPRRLAGRHPWEELSKNEEARIKLADYLGKLIQEIIYQPWGEPWSQEDLINGAAYYNTDKDCQRQETDDITNRLPSELDGRKTLSCYDSRGLWRPDSHLKPEVLSSYKYGLPTGLAISGLLLNVALTSTDLKMCLSYEEAKRNEKSPVVYMRFVDDVILLSPDRGQIERSIELFLQSLQKSNHNFQINLEKIKPELIGHSIKKYWQGLIKKEEQQLKLPLHSRWALTRANLEVFTTTTVKEMSDLGEEALDERYGGPSFDRLAQLLNMVGRKEEDEEVATDARLSFAINKLARANWPDSPIRVDGILLSQYAIVTEILLAAEKTIRNYPWRFKLWKSLLIIALRANLTSKNNKLGEEWLEKQIFPLLSWQSQKIDGPSWESNLPAEPQLSPDTIDPEVALRRYQHRRLRTSFHRTHFWRQWTSIVRALQAIANGDTNVINDLGTWVSHFTSEAAKQSLKWFADIRKWLTILYKNQQNYWPPDETGKEQKPFLWWWEAEALNSAILTVCEPQENLLKKLGKPKAGRLRQTEVLQEALRQVLGSEYSIEELRKASQNILVATREPELKLDAEHIEQNGKEWWVLWLAMFRKGPIAKVKLKGLVPDVGRKPLVWAALSRIGFWEEVVDRRWLDEIIWEKPSLGKKMKPTWENIILLDTYAQIRRLVMANGFKVL
ncbi:MAG: hypothetical protein M1299_07220 [Firmicutes bacterium]|nr:hypothetical protein [Bacillota bacterium]